jgi:hypothetical protein
MEQMLYDILGTVGYNFNFNKTFDHSSLEDSYISMHTTIK